MAALTISDDEFKQFKGLIYDIAGISMSEAKKALVCGRLSKRLNHYGFDNYGDYFKLLKEGAHQELQMAVDLLTTNETYFFREPKHFDFLREQALPQRRPGIPFRVWSAACSSGEEVYTLAMVMADVLGGHPWEVVGSDISSRVLDKAKKGHYPLMRAKGIPPEYLRRFCLKGVGSQEGSLLVNRTLRQQVQFRSVNLNERLPQMGEFDVIFLRNVMIYFSMETKREVVKRLVPLLRPGGYFIISHSESLNGVNDELKVVSPSIYRKPYV